MKTRRVASRAAALLAAGPLMFTLASCDPDAPADDGSRRTPAQRQTAPTTSGTTNASGIDRPITEADVIGVWNNHRDADLHQQIRFTADHEWHEDQHGTRNIYQGTWEITGKRTVMLHDWEEEIRFSPDNYKEFTVISFAHILTKDSNTATSAR